MWPARRLPFPALILLAIVTGGLALIGASRLLLFAAHTPRDQQAASPTGAPDSFAGRSRALPSLPQQTAPPPGAELVTDDEVIDSASAAESTEPPAKPRLDHQAISQLVALAGTTTDRWLKADIIDELATRRDNAAIPTITALLHDKDRDVRRAAANALAELNAEDQVPAMRAALAAEPDGAIRLAFQEALHELDRPSPQ